MLYIFGIFRPLQINYVCEHFRLHGNRALVETNLEASKNTICKASQSFKNSESVKCRFSKCCFSVLSCLFNFIFDGGCSVEK